MKLPLVSVTIVTHNSRQFIGSCLHSVFGQQGVRLEVVVVDNASSDGTRQLLAGRTEPVKTILSGRNLGFAEGQNVAIRATTGEWVLTLNPDVILNPDFLRNLIDSAAGPRVGCLCGKLLRLKPDLTRFELARIDSAGMFFTPELRHFDRGWNEPDTGQYDQPQFVFGSTAAAALYRREMIDEISFEGRFFDPDFFAYREDADVAWRAQIQGWRCLYAPQAVAWHVRKLTPANCRRVSPLINMHSVKNRFLMRIKNVTGPLYRSYWWQISARDAVVLGGCLLWEHSSLRAFPLIYRAFRRALAWRRQIMSRRRITDEQLSVWFAPEPAAQPCPETPPAFARPPLHKQPAPAEASL